MESTISYIIIIVIVILSIMVYNYKKKQTRRYLLSVQQFPELNLEIKIQKHLGVINAILVVVYPKTDLILADIKIELISAKREFNYYSLDHLIHNINLPTNIVKNKMIEFEVPFESFKSLLADGEHPFRTFRFLVTSNINKPYKSHEMGFNKKWVIYRPDTGSYN